MTFMPKQLLLLHEIYQWCLLNFPLPIRMHLTISGDNNWLIETKSVINKLKSWISSIFSDLRKIEFLLYALSFLVITTVFFYSSCNTDFLIKYIRINAIKIVVSFSYITFQTLHIILIDAVHQFNYQIDKVLLINFIEVLLVICKI